MARMSWKAPKGFARDLGPVSAIDLGELLLPSGETLTQRVDACDFNMFGDSPDGNASTEAGVLANALYESIRAFAFRRRSRSLTKLLRGWDGW